MSQDLSTPQHNPDQATSTPAEQTYSTNTEKVHNLSHFHLFHDEFLEIIVAILPLCVLQVATAENPLKPVGSTKDSSAKVSAFE